MLDDVLKSAENLEDAALERMMALLRIPSVSTDPKHAEDCRKGAEWVAEHLRGSGLEVEVLETGGHPAVVAKAPDALVVNPGAPRVLFYGHYDVQPPDPLDEWKTPAFEPTIAEGRDGPAVFARGACDDKGQVMTFLEALRAYHEAGEKLPCPVTVLIEGEEEHGSENLPAFLAREKERLAADIVVISDTSMWKPGLPAICYALRGLVYFDLALRGPRIDLHSGVFGGTTANPATILTRVLGQLFDENHRIAIPGFYDDVAEVTEDERKRWAELDFEESDYLGPVGGSAYGEAGLDTLTRRWARPSCDINGLCSGYTGEGAKTVLPAVAKAKVSFRIPAAMDPEKVASQFEAWLRGRDIGPCTWERIDCLGKAASVATPTDSPYIEAASRAVKRTTGNPPALVREGATIPVVAEFKTQLGLDSMLLGFGLETDAIHSPNEHFGIERFKLGIRTHIALLAEMAAS
ncbi:M20/M25/M40 family metallo-hydrolase [Mucisphaera sp.]|uniref:M20/M25/M40 family metallo-hydrolase n=1 Tax=Mucisphaera sp. TaxID=2913024 RepID=UPI003D112864